MDALWLGFAIWNEETAAWLRAHAEGREPTVEELVEAQQRAFDTFVNAGTQHTLAQVKAAEVMRPRRGLFGWLFG